MEGSDKPKRYARDFAVGERAFDHTDVESGLRALVTRGGFSFCAYVGVQADHTLAGLEDFEFDCHWGVNWSSWGDGDYLPTGWYWWGWDYGHAFDRVDFPGLPPEVQARLDAMWESFQMPQKDWTVEEVTQDALDVLVTLREQLAHSEQLATLALPAARRPQ
jgi:hypothetical protein